MNVKKKIWLGTLFLFFLLLLTGGAGIYYMAKLKTQGKNILQANYESLQYCHIMQQQLNSVEIDYIESLKNFEDALKKQEINTTEPGEKHATAVLRFYFEKIKNGDTIKQNFKGIQNQIQQILTLNMKAINRKNMIAEKTADEAFTLISTLGGLVFLIGFSFLLNFPSVITKPILQFSEAIKEISKKNYSHRIHIENKDEFGNLAAAFNQMARQLEYFESSNLE